MKTKIICIFTLILSGLILVTGCQPLPKDTDNKKEKAASFKVEGSINKTKVSKSLTLSGTSDPSYYSVMVSKYELLESSDDSDPFVVYQSEGDEYAIVELSSDTPTYLGTGRVKEGKYSYCRATIVAIGQTIPVYNEDNIDEPFYKSYIKTFTDFDNSDNYVESLPSEMIYQGEVLVAENSLYNWFEINQTKEYSYSLDKNDITPYIVEVCPGEEVKTIQLTSPIEIEDGETYTGSLTFNIADTFLWDDLDEDNKFEPTYHDHAGTKINDFTFDIAMPEVTAHISKD